ncbi:bestrophin-4 isoform X2 [Daktulosphaira vitifoliae]|uniref:bestrophin-4 isoform X2 n=1 Tax=Daktulosphaira vitifoliae TaxID=58002 RepID=UPI0021A9F954|nr:bestrophin-4 isoform X2 [Daktulosphaira vitifoliae]
MTVSYSRLVANGSSFGCFGSILCKWRGSVYKLVWRELAAYLMVYFAINLAYRFAFTETQQKLFIKVRSYLAGHSASVPLTFAMSFYVGLVVKRWWEQYRLLPWPDTLALFVSAAIPGTTDERGRLMRRNIVRYAVLAYVITLKHVSIRVKKRFPTLQHIVDAGLMMTSEKEILESIEAKTPMTNYWIPLTWANNIINRARREKLISNDQMVQTILLEMSNIRFRLGSLIGYDGVNIPILYSQVVTLSLYAYFGAQLIGAQMVEPPVEWGFKDFKEFDLYVPVLTIVEFCFFVGWLKVAEVLIGPFGEDDDDIELNWLIDRHIKAAYMIVDEMHEEHPELLKDQYWDEVVPKDLPYTVASEHYRRHEPKGSAEFYKVKESDALYANMAPPNILRKSAAHDDMYADYESVDTPMAERRKNWFQRQMHRMGSMRSSSTTYSSGGLFNRTRHNSVYSSPENGIPVGAVINGHVSGVNTSTPQMQKMTLYDRLWGRKSMKSRRGSVQGSNKMNARGRPRIPTPDVQKDNYITDKENTKQNASVNGSVQSGLHPSDIPVVQVVLSPIQENPGTLRQHRGHNNVSQGVLNPAFNNAALNSTTVFTTRPMTVSMSPIALSTVSMSQPLLTSLGITHSTTSINDNNNGNIINAIPSLVLTDITSTSGAHSDKDDSACGGSSSGSVSSTDERKTPASNRRKRGEVYV